jgi:hypothetical protein
VNGVIVVTQESEGQTTKLFLNFPDSFKAAATKRFADEPEFT